MSGSEGEAIAAVVVSYQSAATLDELKTAACAAYAAAAAAAAAGASRATQAAELQRICAEIAAGRDPYPAAGVIA